MSTSTPPVEWNIWLFKEQPVRGLCGLVIVAALTFSVRWVMDSSFWGCLTVIFLLITLRSFFLPQSFRLDDEGITASTLLWETRLPWSRVRRFEFRGRQGMLSTRATPSVMDSLWAMRLMFPEDAAPVIERIQAHLTAREAVCSNG